MPKRKKKGENCGKFVVLTKNRTFIREEFLGGDGEKELDREKGRRNFAGRIAELQRVIVLGVKEDFYRTDGVFLDGRNGMCYILSVVCCGKIHYTERFFSEMLV